MNSNSRKPVLSPARRLFCHRFVVTSHIENSVKEAFPRTKNSNAASTAGNRLMKIPEVRKYIAELQEEIHGTADDIIEDGKRTKEELDILVHSDVGNFFTPDSEEGKILARGGKDRKAVKAIKITTRHIGELEIEKTVELTFYDKNAAIRTDCEVKKLLSDTLKVLHITKPEVYVPENGRNRPVNETSA
jgi:undecaprenyl pyrophosphate synthase